MAASLRSKDHDIIRSPSQFPDNVLPNKESVLKRLLLSKEALLANSPSDKAKPKVEQFAQVVVAELITSWGQVFYSNNDASGNTQGSLCSLAKGNP